MPDEKVFTLEALQAAHGDCLLLHYGTLAAPRLILIDGGPPGIYKASLAPRLSQLRTARGGGVLEVRMVMVSHIDADHIAGVLEFFADLKKTLDAKQAVPYDILTLWHNSFDDLVGAMPAEVQDLVRTSAPRLTSRRSEPSEAQMVVASVPQGIALRRAATALSLNVNSGFDGVVSFTPADGAIDMGQQLFFTVLGPRKAEIDALQVQWAKEVKRAQEKKKTQKGRATDLDLDVLAAEFVDTSITNLSSLVVLAQYQGRSMLLTGDARGDFIVDSLRDSGKLAGGKIKVDVLKVPHHGSERDVAKSFFETIIADHYVFSADGKYDNPDLKTFEMLFAARPQGTYTLWLTNEVKPVLKSVRKIKPASVVVKVRSRSALSVKIDLFDPLPA
jgi:hypothetical protein